MKASELDPKLFPQKEVVQAYEKVGNEYELTVHDRVWNWWYPLIKPRPNPNKDSNANAGANGGDKTHNELIDQDIKKIISQLYRLKDSDGKEWLFYNVGLHGNDWKGNRKDFSYVEGLIEGIPVFNYEIEPSTNEVIAGTTQVLEVKKKYTIPFTKENVDKISKDFRNPLSCIVVVEMEGVTHVAFPNFETCSIAS